MAIFLHTAKIKFRFWHFIKQIWWFIYELQWRYYKKEKREATKTHKYAPELLVLCDVKAVLLGQDLYVLHVVVVPVGHWISYESNFRLWSPPSIGGRPPGPCGEHGRRCNAYGPKGLWHLNDGWPGENVHTYSTCVGINRVADGTLRLKE